MFTMSLVMSIIIHHMQMLVIFACLHDCKYEDIFCHLLSSYLYMNFQDSLLLYFLSITGDTLVMYM